MINQQILVYISQQLNSGVNKDSIVSALLSSGWQQQDINEAFNTINGKEIMTKNAPKTSPNQPITQSTLVNIIDNPQANQIINNQHIEKPKSISLLLIFYWIFALLNLTRSAIGGSVLQSMNDSMKKVNPGALDFSLIATVPWLAMIPLISSFLSIFYIYAVLKLPNRSRKAWKIGILTLICIPLSGIITAIIVSVLINNWISPGNL